MDQKTMLRFYNEGRKDGLQLVLCQAARFRGIDGEVAIKELCEMTLALLDKQIAEEATK